MTDFDNAPYSANGSGADSGRQETRGMAYFPAPPAANPPAQNAPAQQVPAQNAPAHAAPAPQQAPARALSAAPAPAQPQPPVVTEAAAAPAAEEVPGKITIADEVVEKIAALAAREVAGVASLPAEGVRVRQADDDLTIDLTLVVEYGAVVMDVAKAARNNVGRATARMLGVRVTAVNITVADVWMPDVAAVTSAANRS